MMADSMLNGLAAATLPVVSTDLVPVARGAGDLSKATIAQLIAAIFPTDANGNLIANVLPRTGTSTALKALAAGGQGELTSATDYPAILQFNGVLGSGTWAEYSPMSHGILTEASHIVFRALNDKELQLIGGSHTTGNGNGSIIRIIGGDCNVAGFSGGNVEIQGGNNTLGGAGVLGVGGNVFIKAGRGSVDNPAHIGYIDIGNGAINIYDKGQLTGLTADNDTPLINFFPGIAPAEQQNPTVINTANGATATIAVTTVAGGTAVNDNDTFNGGSGTGYTIGQIVRALKNYGLLVE